MNDRVSAEKYRAGEEEKRIAGEAGVDLTLIRWMLSLIPAERLMVLQDNIRSLKRLTDAAHKS